MFVTESAMFFLSCISQNQDDTRTDYDCMHCYTALILAWSRDSFISFTYWHYRFKPQAGQWKKIA